MCQMIWYQTIHWNNIIDTYIFQYTFCVYKSMKLNIFSDLKKAWLGARQKPVSSLKYLFCYGENLTLHKIFNMTAILDLN